MTLNKRFFDSLEKQLLKDWGKKHWKNICNGKNFVSLCGVCQVWLAYHSLRDLHGIDYKEVKMKK